MKKAKKVVTYALYFILSFISALFLFVKGTMCCYDLLYGIQNHDRKTVECTADELNGYGIGNLDDSEKMYLTSKGYFEEDSNFDLMIFQRVGLSDYAKKSGSVYREYAYIFTTKNGNYALSSGVWHEVVRGSDRGTSGIDNMVGIVDLRAGMLSGYGIEIYNLLCDHPQASIRLDEYAKDGVVIYPIQMTFFDENHQEIKVVECQNEENISQYPVYQSQDDWLLCDSSVLKSDRMKEYFEGMKISTGKALKYATSISKKLDYSKDTCEKGYYQITRSRVVNYISYTKGNYGYVYVEVVQDPRIPWGVGIGVFILWVISLYAMYRWGLRIF